MVEIDVAAIFEEIIKDWSGSDLATKELANEHQIQYGILTEEDLKKIYTV